MLGTRINFMIGFAFYVIGLIVSNFIPGGIAAKFSFPLPTELAVISLGLMALSVFYYSQFSFAVMFSIGLLFGGMLFTNPLFIILAIFPLGVAHSAGMDIGVSIKDDLTGRRNIWSEKKKLAMMIIIVIALSAATGYMAETIKFAVPTEAFVVELPW